MFIMKSRKMTEWVGKRVVKRSTGEVYEVDRVEYFRVILIDHNGDEWAEHNGVVYRDYYEHEEE